MQVPLVKVFGHAWTKHKLYSNVASPSRDEGMAKAAEDLIELSTMFHKLTRMKAFTVILSIYTWWWHFHNCFKFQG